MVNSKPKKISKVSYAERVLGAFTQLQKDHRKHSIHLATIRAQVKRNAQAKKEKLGPQWSHWVGKAVAKLESEGILEPATPTGSVALTSSGKQAIARARRSIIPNTVNDFSAIEEQLIWKQVVSGVSKRVRASSVDNNPGSTSATPKKNRKRAGLSDSPNKKTISKMTKAELKAELDWLREQARVHYLLRGVSPLTDLDDEEELQNSQLRVELKEREEEIEKMGRELFAARAARHEIQNDDETNEPDISFRPMTPEATTAIAYATPTPSRIPAAAPSRVYSKGLTRTTSGSFISNISKQPTPAPSSPDRDMSTDCARTGDWDFDFTEHPVYDNAGTSIDQSTPHRPSDSLGADVNGYDPHEQDDRLTDRSLPATPQNRVDKRSSQDQGVVWTLKVEIENLRKQLQDKTAALYNREAEVKALSDRAASFDSVILNREGTIAAMGEANTRLSAEVAEKEQSWKQAEDMVAKTAKQLAVAQSSVEALKTENTSIVDRLTSLESSNEELRRERDALQNSIELLKQREADLETVKQELQIRITGVFEKLELQNKICEEKCAEIANLNAKHSTDLQVARQKNDDLEKMVSIYRAEVEEKGLSIESLGNELNQKDIHIEGLSTKLREVGKSAEDLSSRFSGAQTSIALLTRELADAKQSAQDFKMSLEATVSELESEVTGRHELAAKLSEKEKEIDLERENANQLRGYVEKLECDIATKGCDIQQLAGEVEAVRKQGALLEESLASSIRTLDLEREQNTAQLSNLKGAVASAKADLAGATENLADANRQLIALTSDLRKKNAELDKLTALLDEECQEKSRLSAELQTYVSKTYNLQEELRQYDASQSLDEATILDLRLTLTSIRKSQLQMWGEIEEKIISAQPSPSPRQKTSNINSTPS